MRSKTLFFWMALTMGLGAVSAHDGPHSAVQKRTYEHAKISSVAPTPSQTCEYGKDGDKCKPKPEVVCEYGKDGDKCKAKPEEEYGDCEDEEDCDCDCEEEEEYKTPKPKLDVTLTSYVDWPCRDPSKCPPPPGTFWPAQCKDTTGCVPEICTKAKDCASPVTYPCADGKCNTEKCTDSTKCLPPPGSVWTCKNPQDCPVPGPCTNTKDCPAPSGTYWPCDNPSKCELIVCDDKNKCPASTSKTVSPTSTWTTVTQTIPKLGSNLVTEPTISLQITPPTIKNSAATIGGSVAFAVVAVVISIANLI
ncbi:hypothetical protein DFH27DRAFT_608305 [Peziza echinospora]|nr:hypothetical protein DFH27DRAFT_608305 [Peziza echinospora]